VHVDSGLGLPPLVDDAALLAVQPFCPPEVQPEPDVCVDFQGFERQQTLPPSFEKDSFRFTALDGEPQFIVAFGDPFGENKLAIHEKGEQIDLPFTADRVQVTISGGIVTPVVVTAYDATNSVVDEVQSPPSGTVRDATVEGSGITRITITNSARLLLIRVCAHPESPVDSPRRDK